MIDLERIEEDYPECSWRDATALIAEVRSLRAKLAAANIGLDAMRARILALESELYGQPNNHLTVTFDRVTVGSERKCDMTDTMYQGNLDDQHPEPRICACGRPTTDRYAEGQAQCLRCAHSEPASEEEVDDE